MKFKKLLVASFMATLTSAVFAQAFPNKPITIVVPFPPGGSTDSVARAIMPKMNAELGQSIVVDNKPGATGAIGATAVKRSPADGYTMMVGSIGVYATNPFLQKNLQYDPLKDFDLLTVAVRAPNVLVASPNFPAGNMKELMEYLKKNPGKTTFATSGAGSSDHLTTALFWQKTGTDGIHVPYKGGAPAITDLLGNQVNISFQNINVIVKHVQAGKLKAIAITSDKRSPLLPNVPTLLESGIKDVDVYSWQAIVAPKGLPADVKKKLHTSVVNALNAPDVKKNMTDVGFEIVANTPEQFEQFLKKELARWKTVIEVGKLAEN
jgi:tripartite-type tricarboxylate transporter receptor subunit TctC